MSGSGSSRAGRSVRQVAACLLTLSAACGGGGGPGPGGGARPARSYALGFTDFPYARSAAALAEVSRAVARDGDLAALHFDEGVPWQEALSGAPYPAAVREELERKRRSIPPGHLVYVAVTPIAFSRDGLAPRWGEAGTEPLEPPWDGRGFDDPAVVAAFRNHCERMIERFSPDLFAFAIEANQLAELAPARWPGFVALAGSVYRALKAHHRELPIFWTLETEAFHRAPDSQRRAIADALASTDLVAVSAYPFSAEADPALLADGYFADLARLAPEKPFAVAETGWPAEDVTAPYPVFLPGSEAAQLGYVRRLLAEADRLSAAFVVWFLVRDYDDLWESELGSSPLASVARLWRDTGLYAGSGAERPALELWRERLVAPRSAADARPAVSLRPAGPGEGSGHP